MAMMHHSFDYNGLVGSDNGGGQPKNSLSQPLQEHLPMWGNIYSQKQSKYKQNSTINIKI